jgi:aryl-alcohol dehydrogenase-like predicted oxidoreductase
MNKLILGTAQFGLNYGINNSNGQPSFDQVAELLDFASLNGISELDTANAYGNAQEVLGQYFEKSLNQFRVKSKFILDSNFNFKSQLLNTLATLKLKSLDGYYFHRFNDYLSFQYFDQAKIAKEEGLIKFLGVSLYKNEELEIVAKDERIDLIQLPFNLLDNDVNKQELLKIAHENGKKIYVRSVFLQGLFFKETNSLPVNLLPLKRTLQKLHQIIHDSKFSIEELALNYVHSKSFIDGILIGVDSVDQLSKNLKSLEISPPSNIFQEIENIKIEHKNLLTPANWSIN